MFIIYLSAEHLTKIKPELYQIKTYKLFHLFIDFNYFIVCTL